MQALFCSRPALPLGVSRGLALPARFISHQRLSLPRRSPGNGQPLSSAPARVPNHFRMLYAQCRCYAANVKTKEVSEQALTPEAQADPGNNDFWDSYENTYEASPRDTHLPKKPHIKASGYVNRDSASQQTESLLSNQGNSRTRQKGRWKHQVVAPINGKNVWSRAFVPFFDYREWGWLRHQIPPESIPKMRRMHRHWKEHCQQVRVGRWETKFDPAITRLLPECESAEAMLEIWGDVQAYDILSIWRPVILSIVAVAPGRGAIFLEATTRGEWQPPGYMISDILRLEAQLLDNIKDKKLRGAAANNLVNIAITIMSRLPKGYSPFRQNDLFRIQQHVTNNKALEFYMMLLEKQIPVHPNTMAQFAYRFALQNSYKPYAMRIIYEVLTSIPGAEKMSAWAKVCTVLFLPGKVKASPHSGGSANTGSDADTGEIAQELWASLIPAGFSPSLIHFTALIRYLCLHGHMETAWKVFDVVVEHDIQPDPVLYATLLDGAKKQLDLDSFQRSLALISTNNTATVATWNTTLHYVLSLAIAEAFHRKLPYPRVIPIFAPMLDIYRRIFRMDSLEKLLPGGFDKIRVASDLHDWRFAQDLLHPIHSALPELRDDQKLEPSTTTLVIMMISYLKNATMSYDVMVFYTRFRSLLVAGDPMATALVREQGTVVHDMVIKAFAGWPGLLRASVDVFNDMMPGNSSEADNSSTKPASTDQPPTPKAQSADTDSSEPIPQAENADELVDKPIPQFVHPPPSIYTWNILLHSWVIQRSDNTDQVLQMMQEHGIKPILISWNTLISGYARAQHPQQVSETLIKLHRSGFQPDDWTRRAFARLRDKETVIRGLQKAINEGADREGGLDEKGFQSLMSGL
ncbi:Pentatricopeptide repeat-containing protein mitochondrial [Ceratocystis platani]|uniref:Pentatricopeptide repeat-containing protein mitochondrial n=1 Tax=Ceratocystis fimbriata f. sp. platani TaxID=88771 RepID=A0A0F8B1L6_CERFI|nr:Pentatricopeptide repeat-containing protein mitochondrial [Ceratocystis platani]